MPTTIVSFLLKTFKNGDFDLFNAFDYSNNDIHCIVFGEIIDIPSESEIYSYFLLNTVEEIC